MTNIDPIKILAMPMEKNGAGAKNLWEYLIAVQDSFYTSLRPISDPFETGKFWIEDDIIYHLILNKVIAGNITDKGHARDYNASEYRSVMRSLFTHLRTADITTLQQPPEPKDYTLLQLSDLDKAEPYIADHEDYLMSKDSAEKTLEVYKKNAPNEHWVLVKVK